MIGSRFVFASEGSDQMRWSTAFVKLLTGGDPVSMRRIFCTQRLVRLKLIPFDHRVPAEAQIPDLAARLVKEEGAGILNWLEGLAMVLRDGIGEPPEEVRAVTDAHLDTADEPGRYLDERTTRDKEDASLTVGAQALYA